MADDTSFPFSFDPAAVIRDMNQRFGWKEADVHQAMSALMPAALAGFKLNSGTPDAFKMFEAYMPGSSQAGVGDPMSLFFGPEAVRKAVAEHVAGMTGLKQEAIAEMMPVTATLAMGTVARPFFQGPAREMFDAFMAGYARGRPKPVQTPAEMMQPYSDAIQAFWNGFLGADPSKPKDEPEPTPAEEPAPEEDTLESVLETADDWISIGQDIQASQVKAFETFYENAFAFGQGRGAKRD